MRDVGDKDEDEDEDECDKEEKDKVDDEDDVADKGVEGDVGENSRLENSFVDNLDLDFAKALAHVELPSSRS